MKKKKNYKLLRVFQEPGYESVQKITKYSGQSNQFKNGALKRRGSLNSLVKNGQIMK